MTENFWLPLGFDALLPLVAVIFALLFIHHGRRLLRNLRLEPHRQVRLNQVGLLLECILWVVLVVVIVPAFFRGRPTVVVISVLLAIAGCVAACWFIARDYLAGFLLRAEQSWESGDMIQCAEIHGTIKRLGLRVVEVETSEGRVALVPYSLLAQQIAVRTRIGPFCSSHTLRLVVPMNVDGAEASANLRRVLLNHHWVPPGQTPRLRHEADGAIEVTYACFSSDQASKVAGDLKHCLERAAQDA